MNKNVHNSDDVFRKAYQNLEEEPSSGVWYKLSAELDKRDAIHYRIRFAWWRNVAVMLLLMLGSFAAHELFVSHATNYDTDTATKNVPSKQAPGVVTDQLQNPPGTSNIENNVSENNKPDLNENPVAKQHYDQKLYTLVVKKQSFDIQKITPQKKTNEKAGADGHSIAFNETKGSASGNINTGTSGKPARTEKNNAILNNSSGFASTELKTDALPIKPGISADKKTIKVPGLYRHYWSFSPYASIGFAGYHLDDDYAFRSPGEPDERNAITKRENHEFSYALGFFARYHFTRWFNIKTGLSYSNTSIAIQPQTLHTSPANDYNGYKFVTSAGYAYLEKTFGTTPSAGDSIYVETAEHHTSYMDIPLMAAYTINPASRLTMRPGIGIATHIFLGSKAETEIKKGADKEHISLTKFKGQSPLYFSLAGDAEFNYRINKKLCLLLLPSFTYAINSITTKTVVKTYPYSLQFSGGLTWNLD